MNKGIIGFSVSGIKHYENDFYRNKPSSFTALSVTGSSCSLCCAHCNGLLLLNMYDASSAEKFITRVDQLADAGSQGVLISGGSDTNGAVPLLPFMEGIAHAKKRGLKG